MLSTTSGFTEDQVRRFRAMFHVLLAGLVILIFGLGIVCFGRMYTFDHSNYDLFLVFGIIIVTISIPVMVLPVYCQLRIYLEVRRDSKSDEMSSAPAYAPVLHQGMGTLPQKTAAAPYTAGTYPRQQQQQQQLPFSSATYMMSQQPQQSLIMPRDPRLVQGSVASSESSANRPQGRSLNWAPGKPI